MSSSLIRPCRSLIDRLHELRDLRAGNPTEFFDALATAIVEYSCQPSVGTSVLDALKAALPSLDEKIARSTSADRDKFKIAQEVWKDVGLDVTDMKPEVRILLISSRRLYCEFNADCIVIG